MWSHKNHWFIGTICVRATMDPRQCSNSYFKNHTSSSELSESGGEESVEFSAVLVRSTSSMWSVGKKKQKKKQNFLATEFLNRSDYTIKKTVHHLWGSEEMYFSHMLKTPTSTQCSA